MRASVLGIGTELTTGQIVNKNAAWISGMLKAQGVLTNLHLVVPDERPLMMQALKICAEQSDVLFLTGGLGPTSDDFTRDVVADWCGQPLEFHPPSWEHLSERLTSRGYTVKEIQRQQCFFPRGAQVIANSQGTANAFYLQFAGKDVFVLPGPPREIEAVWSAFIDSWLKQKTAHLDKAITRSWDTLGVGESDIAMIVEDIVKGYPVTVGYRVHLPYVEVKIDFASSQATQVESLIQQLTIALSHCTVLRDGEDVVEKFKNLSSRVQSLQVIDEVSGTFMQNRLAPAMRGWAFSWSWCNDEAASATHSDVVLRLKWVDELRAEVALYQHSKWQTQIIEAPHKTANMKERRQQYFAEHALILWSQWLTL